MVCSFSVLGFAAALFIFYKLVRALHLIFYPHIIAKLLGHTLDLKTLGKWAVVTGATDGIGKGYAIALAKRGINVLLISRSEDKLKAVVEEIRKSNTNKVDIRYLVLDFQKATPEVYRTKVADSLKDLEVGLLINNVGMSYSQPEKLHEIEKGEEFLQNVVMVNDVSTLQMSRLVLPQMIRRNKGAIVNISSAAGFAPMPMLTVYSATKIFMDYMTQGLSYEYADTGLIFQNVNPFYVVTKMSGLTRTSFWAPGPDKYASAALDTIGLISNTSGCFSHDIQRVGMKLMVALMPEAMFGKQSMNALKKVSANFQRAMERQKAKAQ